MPNAANGRRPLRSCGSVIPHYRQPDGLGFCLAIALGCILYAELNRVIWGVHQVLLGPEIPFRSLDRGVTEEKLDLFQFAAGCSAEFGAGAPQVMRCEPGNASRLRIPSQHLPDDLLSEPFTLHSSSMVHSPEN